MSQRLMDSIRAFSKKEKTSFHMPGHKGGKGMDARLKKHAFALDTTELSGTDNLHDPKGVISLAQEHAAKVFDAKETFFCVNGATGALHAAIFAAVGRGGKIIAGRSSHSSVLSAAILYGIEIIFYEESYLESFGIYTMPSFKTVVEILDKHADAKAFLLTSPNYYGVCGDISRTAQAVHRRNMIFIVDEAHGTHFSFSPLLPKSAVRSGADLVINSAHKTLASPNQTAFLHLCGERIGKKAIQQALSLVETSSPSFLLLCAMDEARERAEKRGKTEYASLVRNIIFLRHQIEKKTKCRVLCGSETGFANIHELDPTRLVINFRNYDTNAAQISELLAERYGIYVEMADRYNLVCIITPSNSAADLHRLLKAVTSIANSLTERQKELTPVPPPAMGRWIMPPHEAYHLSAKSIPLSEAAGKASKYTLALYPPGTPLAAPGQEITSEMAEYMQNCLDAGLCINGLENNMLWVLED